MTPDNNYSMAMVNSPSPQDQRIFDLQLNLLSQNINATLLGSAACLTFMLFILSDLFENNELIVWGMISGAILLARYGYHHYFSRTWDKQADKRTWLRIQYLGAMMTGSMWGYAGIFFIPEQAMYLAIIIILLGGLAAASTAVFASARGLSASLIIPMITPFSVHMMLMGDKLYLTAGITTFVFMLIMLITSERIHQAITDSLRSSIENQDLAEASALARKKTQQLNHELRNEIENRKRTEAQIEKSQRELSRILENMQDTYNATNLNGEIIRVSSSVESLLGYTQKEIIGQKLSELYQNPEDQEAFLAALNTGNGKVQHYAAALKRKDNSVVWVSTCAQYIKDEQGNITGVEGTTRDISALKEAERALFEEKEKAEVTLNSIGDGVITLDIGGNIDYINPAAEHFTGWSQEEAHGKPVSLVVHLNNADNTNILANIKSYRAIHQQPRLFDDDTVLQNRFNDGEHSVEINISDLRDTENNCRGSVMILHDVTRLRGMAREMSYQATHDSLTGLINRSDFERRLAEAIEETAENPHIRHALMYLDLDQFKIVNDTCGHIAGDELLKQLTYELHTRVRGNDVLARLGGDEFGVLLKNCEIKKAESVAEALRDITQRFRFMWDDKAFEIGVSIGLVPIHNEGGDLASYLSAADSACYVAKDMGRNRVHIFHGDDEALAQRHGQMQWIQRIKQALEDDRIALHCQVVHPINKPGTKAYYREVLMRLIDENGELVPPNDFIPAAERYNLMPSIDRWVIKTALHHFGNTKNLDSHDIVAINLSGQSLADENFLAFMIEQLQFSGINPQQVCLEITETAAISNQARASEFISVLQKKGCLFALDDFGSGLSSFGYLKRMPVDFLKIDGVFIRDINEDPIHYAMVESINHIGHVFGMQTIAEFVENDQVLEALRDMGVDYAQGFGIAKPEPLPINDSLQRAQLAS